MLRSKVMRGVLAGAALAGLTALGAGTASAAEGDPVFPCHLGGYVCMTMDDYSGQQIYVHEGLSYVFERPGAVTSISNDTTVTYCVSAEYNFSVRPGETIAAPHTINSMSPSASGSCIS